MRKKYNTFSIHHEASAGASDTIHFPDVGGHISRGMKASDDFYELDLLRHLSCSKIPEGVFVDVGANIGNHTAYFSKYLASRVIAIEPHSEIFRALKYTIQINSLANVDPLNLAAGSKSGVVSLSNLDDLSDNWGGCKILPWTSSKLSNKEMSPIDTLDSLISLYAGEKISLIKIDVEGHETDVLQGSIDIIKRDLPDLVVEFHEKEVLDANFLWLSHYGYKNLGRFCSSPTYHLSVR